jgi:CRP/FNR family transcriptional regulator
MARLKRKVHRSAELFHAGTVLTSLYVVRSGTFKTLTTSHIGRSKITAFYLPGDLLGLDAIAGGAYAFDCIALEESEVCVLPLARLEQFASSVPDLLEEFVRVLSAELTRDRQLLTLLGCMDAEHRVARFLLSLASRYARLGYSNDALLLHMSRDDIAGYLGLASETVSRVMSNLYRRGVLTIHQRHVEVNDSAQLASAGAW